jgi:two-component system, LytTR family, sensor kinase
MQKNNASYWLFQLAGWGMYILLYTFFYITLSRNPDPHFYNNILTEAVLGFVLTHIMRLIIKSSSLLQRNLKGQVLSFFGLTVLFSLLFSTLSMSILQLLKWELEDMTDVSLFRKIFSSWFGSFLFILIWNLIYFTYHYISNARKQEVDKMKLETLVKELELKTIKAHINPHFIFNALNSIRALVDENPGRARTAITELSNLLRSSMNTEKEEMIPLEKELAYVKNYLALEQIRFESRLNVEMDIDSNTLNIPVPPMMLQTLVENAIKHGISKLLEGGKVKISSTVNSNNLELTICNSGRLNDNVKQEGFGIDSTINRLKLLYDNKAKFEIKNKNENFVEAKLLVPIQK